MTELTERRTCPRDRDSDTGRTDPHGDMADERDLLRQLNHLIDWHGVTATADEGNLALERLAELGPLHGNRLQAYSRATPNALAQELDRLIRMRPPGQPDRAVAIARDLASRARPVLTTLARTLPIGRGQSRRSATRQALKTYALVAEGAGVAPDSWRDDLAALRVATARAVPDWWPLIGTGRPPKIRLLRAPAHMSRKLRGGINLGSTRSTDRRVTINLPRLTALAIALRHALPPSLGLTHDQFFDWDPCSPLIRGAISPGRILAHELCHAATPRTTRAVDPIGDAALVQVLTGSWQAESNGSHIFDDGLMRGICVSTDEGSDCLELPMTIGLNEGLAEVMAEDLVDRVRISSPEILWASEGFARWEHVRVTDGGHHVETRLVRHLLGDADPWTYIRSPGALDRLLASLELELAPSDRLLLREWLYFTNDGELARLTDCHVGLGESWPRSQRSAMLWLERARDAAAIAAAVSAAESLVVQIALGVSDPAAPPPIRTPLTTLAKAIAEATVRETLFARESALQDRAWLPTGAIGVRYREVLKRILSEDAAPR